MGKNKFLLCTLLLIPSATSADDSGVPTYLDYAIKAAISVAITTGGTYIANSYFFPKNKSDLEDKYKLASLAAKALGEKGRQKMSTGSYGEMIEGFIETKVADEMISLAIVDVELSYIKEQSELDDTYCDYHDKSILLEKRKKILSRLSELNSKEYRESGHAEKEFTSFVQLLQERKTATAHESEKQSGNSESTVSKLRQHAQQGAATAN
jgi:hypothetical protein